MNVVITGVSTGIGSELLLSFLREEGHNIIGLSRTAETLPLDLSLFLSRARLINFDIGLVSEADNERLFSCVERELGHIDILINNAGRLINKPFAELSSDEWQSLFAVNFFGIVNLVRILLPLMGKDKGTHIVNLGSMGGFQGTRKFRGLSAYSASKAALANLTECLASELSGDNIKVNCLALGAVDTEMLQAAFPGYRAPVTSGAISEFIRDFSKAGNGLFNGKILPVSLTDPA